MKLIEKDTRQKELYEAPSAEVLELKTENGILTASQDQYEPEQW